MRPAPAQRVDLQGRRAPLPHPGRGRRRPVPRRPKKAGDPDGGIAEEPADKPAVGAYRRRKASCNPTVGGHPTSGGHPHGHPSERSCAMTTGPQVRAAGEELVAQLDHADRLITAQAERIEALEAEVEVLLSFERRSRIQVTQRRRYLVPSDGPGWLVAVSTQRLSSARTPVSHRRWRPRPEITRWPGWVILWGRGGRGCGRAVRRGSGSRRPRRGSG